MKTRFRLLSVVCVLALLSACQTPPPRSVSSAPPPAPAPLASPERSDRNAETARILELHARGVINTTQARAILEALGDGSAADGLPPSAPVPVPTESDAPTPTSHADTVVAASVPMLDPRYQPQQVVTGRLRSIGSDTMDLLVAEWERVFARYHPDLRIIHEGRGSSTATPALTENQADIGPMSRPMLEAEVTKFRERFGYDATQIRTAIDALGVYVHPDNPIARTGLSLAQLDAIFSTTRKRGAAERVATWGHLGLGAEWANAPIRVYGRNRASGTYGFFRDTALGKGEFGPWVEEQPSSARVVEKVEADKFGLGFSGLGYKTPGVVLVPLAQESGAEVIAPSRESALAGTYPLARPLLLALNRDPALPLNALQREFLSFVLGPVGQEVVEQQGYFPLPPALVVEELAKLR